MIKNLIQRLTLIIITLSLFTYCNNINNHNNNDEGPNHEVNEAYNPQFEYDLPVDSFRIETGIVKRNQNLGNILIPLGISPKTMESIASQADIFDVRQIRAGNNYKLYFSKDAANKLQYFIYEQSLTEYVTIKLVDSIEIIVDEKPTTIEKKMAAGTITTNLWDAMIDNHINPLMSIELSEIYAWSIDFFDLKKGDQFYVIYEERLLDTVSAGIEHIHAAIFNHQNKDFYAIYFVQDEQGAYYDNEGDNLHSEFLKTPLKYSSISSRFSKNRMHPVLKIRRAHGGVDYVAPSGTPVYSVGDGYVVKKGYQKKGAGNYIKIKHNSVYTTQYAHLKGFAKELKLGDPVKQGQLIGYVGKTGYATGPHLDFRFFKNGELVDPLKVESPSVEPVKKINKEEFEKIKLDFMQQLNNKRVDYLSKYK